jgi:hypothetical protein
VPAPITANTVLVTQQAQQLFTQNAHDLDQVRKTVDSVICQLTNTGMDPVSIDQLAAGLKQWNTSLDDMITMSQWMAEALGVTWQRIQKNEQDNTDLAAGLTVPDEPQGPRLELSHPTGATVAPGQTVGLRMAIRKPSLPLLHREAAAVAPREPP